jgi:hypothetical protein
MEYEIVPDSERALEIQSFLEGTLLDTIHVTRKPVVRIGERSARRRATCGRRRAGIDVEIPGSGPSPWRFPLAVLSPGRVSTYAVMVPEGFAACLRRGGAEAIPVEASRFLLEPLDELTLRRGGFALVLRYVRRRALQLVRCDGYRRAG